MPLQRRTSLTTQFKMTWLLPSVHAVILSHATLSWTIRFSICLFICLFLIRIKLHKDRNQLEQGLTHNKHSKCFLNEWMNTLMVVWTWTGVRSPVFNFNLIAHKLCDFERVMYQCWAFLSTSVKWGLISWYLTFFSVSGHSDPINLSILLIIKNCQRWWSCQWPN